MGQTLIEHGLNPEIVIAQLEKVAGLTHPEWLPELARLELACHQVMNSPLPVTETLDKLTVTRRCN